MDGAAISASCARTFLGCTELEEIEIPAKVEVIQGGCFHNCYNLWRITFAAGSRLRVIGGLAFSVERDVRGSLEIEIPASVETIGIRCFDSRRALFPDVRCPLTFAKGSCLKTIREFAFESCLKLEEMEIPARVETIESSAFFNSGLKRIAFETGCCLKHIESNALANCPLKEIEIPANVKCIDAFCFAGCPLTKVTFAGGHSLKRIEESAFHHCDSIEEIEIPASLEEPVSPLNTGYLVCTGVPILWYLTG